MNRDKSELIASGVIGFLIGLAFLLSLMWVSGTTPRQMKAEAVKRGHAEWVVDVEGDVAFKWK